MLDRSEGYLVPYVFSEYPGLLEKFCGFTYYPNTVSFGGHTNFAAPALYGGYEYTPIEINKRNKETLKSKHDEALKVMPTIFDNADYNVTVCDPPLAGYQNVPDLSIFDNKSDINAYITKGYYINSSKKEILKTRNHNFFAYSIMEIMPLALRSMFYNDGKYNRAFSFEKQKGVPSNISNQSSDAELIESYLALTNLSGMTKVSEDNSNNFLLYTNELTHNDIYERSKCKIESSITKEEVQKLFNITSDDSIVLENKKQISSFNASIESFIILAQWLDYLRDNGVYDNTRIILCADHGFGLNQVEDLILDNTANSTDIDKRFGDASFYNPLLMVKDFNSNEFRVNNEFMTNADVPYIATKDIFDNPTNPFTNKTISNNEKTAHKQYILASSECNVTESNTFVSSRWYSVNSSIWEKDNWSLVAKDAVLSNYQ